LFLLSRRRRILFVNAAWEKLTGLSAAQARGLTCAGRAVTTGDFLQKLAHALTPPPEVLDGKFGRIRRAAAGRTATNPGWWDVDFFPIRDAHGLLGILGKILPATAEQPASWPPLPEKLLDLRLGLKRRYSLDQLPGAGAAMGRVADQVRLAARNPSPFVIRGERGTGKEWLARTIHYQGQSQERAFVAVDCAHLPPPVLAAMLRGPGGLWERQQVAMIYLKEPACLPRDLQGCLQQWLQEHTPGAPRLAAGLSTDPEIDIGAGRLSEDFFCALATLTIILPPLRDRHDDWAQLAERLLDRMASGGPPASGGREPPVEDKRIRGLSAKTWELVRSYAWPGNLWEFAALLVSARLRATGDMIEAADLPAYLHQTLTLARIPAPLPRKPLPLDSLLEQAERRLITLALRRARGNKSQAAELLSIWRPRLLRRMQALGIDDTDSSARGEENADDAP
jgi:DNA-binding NtrC family response regulator